MPAADRPSSQAKARKRRIRRSAIRLKISRRVDYEVDGKATFAYTRDLGRGGLFLRTSRTVAEGTELDLAVTLDGDRGPVRVVGRVSRIVRGDLESGMGVIFHQRGQQEARESIGAFVLATLEHKAKERLSINARDRRAQRELGDIAYERGAIDDAIAHYESLVDSAPPGSVDADFYCLIADLLFAQASETKSEALYERALCTYEKAVQSAGVGAEDGAEDTAEAKEGLAACETALEGIRGHRQAEADKEQQEREQRGHELERRWNDLAARESELALREEDQQQEREQLKSAAERLRQQQEELREGMQRLESLQGATTRNEQQQLQQLEQGRQEILAERQAVDAARNELDSSKEELDSERRELQEARQQRLQQQQQLEVEQKKVDEQREVSKRQELEIEASLAGLKEQRRGLTEGGDARSQQPQQLETLQQQLPLSENRKSTEAQDEGLADLGAEHEIKQRAVREQAHHLQQREEVVLAREEEVGRREQRWNRRRAEGRAKLVEDQNRLARRVNAERARLKQERQSLRNDVDAAQLASRELARFRYDLETDKARLEEETKTITKAAQDLEAQQAALEARQQHQEEQLEAELKERFDRAREKEKELRELEKAIESHSRDLDQRDKGSQEKAADVAAREADLATRQRELEQIEREQAAVEEILTLRATAIADSRPPDAPIDDLTTAHLTPSPPGPPPPTAARLEELEEGTLNLTVPPTPVFEDVVTAQLNAPDPDKWVLPSQKDHGHGQDDLRSQSNLDDPDEQENTELGTGGPSAAALSPWGQSQEQPGMPLDALLDGSTRKVSVDELRSFVRKTQTDGSNRLVDEADGFHEDFFAAADASTRVTRLSLRMRFYLLRQALRYGLTQVTEEAQRKLPGWLPRWMVSTPGLIIGAILLIVALATASAVAVLHLRSLPVTPLESPPSDVSADDRASNPTSPQNSSPGAQEPSGEAQPTDLAPQGGRTETQLVGGTAPGSTGPAKSGEREPLPQRYKTRRARLKAKRRAAKLRRQSAARLSDDEILDGLPYKREHQSGQAEQRMAQSNPP